MLSVPEVFEFQMSHVSCNLIESDGRKGRQTAGAGYPNLLLLFNYKYCKL